MTMHCLGRLLAAPVCRTGTDGPGLPSRALARMAPALEDKEKVEQSIPAAEPTAGTQVAIKAPVGWEGKNEPGPRRSPAAR